jgi:hypothetical protein
MQICVEVFKLFVGCIHRHFFGNPSFVLGCSFDPSLNMALLKAG